MYRKVPQDLMEGSKRGTFMSTFALFAIATLFFMETKAYFSSSVGTDLALDDNQDDRIRLNFNITMMDLKCEFAVVDVVSALGTDQNVTTHITKWEVDAEGVRQRFKGRNRQQHDILMKDDLVTETIEELHEDGVDAVALTPDTLGFTIEENEYVFIDFYASWCSHCRDLAPTWEALAEVMSAATKKWYDANRADYSEEDYQHALKVDRPVIIAKIDCVDHHDLCRDQGIRAYPTLRLFVDGEKYAKGDYRGHRTLVDFTDWLTEVEEEHKKDTDWVKWVHVAQEKAKERLNLLDDEERQVDDRAKRQLERQRRQWRDDEHPGCQLAGHLWLDRVPGNFHVQARSNHHDLVPSMTNVSHEIHHLSIGEPLVEKLIETGSAFLPNEVQQKLAPMDGNVYITKDLHEAYHHYLKVVTTNVAGLGVMGEDMKAYQILQNSQLSYYRTDVVPEAKFIYDLSPIAVSYRARTRHWYDYLTSILAIVGGTFTIFGMLDSGIGAAQAAARRKKHY